MDTNTILISEAARISGYSSDRLRDADSPLKPVGRDAKGRRLFDRTEAERIGAARAILKGRT